MTTKNKFKEIFKFTSVDDVDSLHPNIIGFVPRYISNRKDDYLNLIKAVNEGDFETIRDYCHKVMGTARSYHFFKLEEITKALQDFAREGDLEGVRSLMPAYDAYIQEIFVQYQGRKDN